MSVHEYVGIAYEVGSGLALVAAGLSAMLPRVAWLASVAKGIGAFVADFSKLKGGAS